MVALHLIPIHRALGIQFHSIGWDGQYSLVPMFMDGNRWFAAGDAAMIPREEAESGEAGDVLTIGEILINIGGDDLVIEHKGLPFGKCNAAGYHGALEKARAEAAKNERWKKVVGIEDSAAESMTG